MNRIRAALPSRRARSGSIRCAVLLALLLLSGCSGAGDRDPDPDRPDAPDAVTDDSQVGDAGEEISDDAGNGIETTARPAASATSSRAIAEDLSGRLIFAQRRALGRESIVVLDAASGVIEELFPVAESDQEQAGGYRLSPDGRHLAYSLTGLEVPARIRVRALYADAPLRLDWALPPGVGNTAGRHWQSQGEALILGWNSGSQRAEDEMWLPEAFEIWRLPFDPESPGGVDAQQVYREARGAEAGFTLLGAWDEANGTAALLDGPGENGYVNTIRVLRPADGELVAEWPTGGEGYRHAAIPRKGWPGASWLAVVDEKAWEKTWEEPSSPMPSSRVLLIDLELDRGLEIAEVPAGMSASALTTSADGEFLAWSETPIGSGTGLRKRIRFVQIRDEIGPASVLTGAEGLGAIPLAFEPAKPGSWPRLLTGDGIYRLDLASEGSNTAAEIRADLPWSLPKAPDDVYPNHPLLGLGELIGWVPDESD